MMMFKEFSDRKTQQADCNLTESKWLRTGASVYYGNQHKTHRKKAVSRIDQARSELTKAKREFEY